MKRWATLAALIAAGCLGEPQRAESDAASVADAGDPCDGVSAGECELFTCPGSRSCYRVCLPQVTFPEAVSACTGDEQVLQTETEDELQCLQAHNRDNLWLGLLQSNAATTSDAGWTWLSNDETPADPFWDVIEPNDSVEPEDGDEQCAIVLLETGLWADVPCDGLFATTACELPAR